MALSQDSTESSSNCFSCLNPGWLERTFEEVNENLATWPEWMLREAGLSQEQIRELKTPNSSSPKQRTQRRCFFILFYFCYNQLHGGIPVNFLEFSVCADNPGHRYLGLLAPRLFYHLPSDSVRDRRQIEVFCSCLFCRFDDALHDRRFLFQPDRSVGGLGQITLELHTGQSSQSQFQVLKPCFLSY